MIPRYQRVLFWILIASITLSTLFLLRGCRQAHQRLTAPADTTPIDAPTTSSTQDVALYLASDATGAISVDERSLALPVEPTSRARALLNRLLADYSLPNSAHPLPSGPAVDEVFLVKLPLSLSSEGSAHGELAVVDLHQAFAASHPSGILTEALTVESVIGTLHAAFPDLTQVRFLVNGHPSDTLAGHADLQRTYPAIDTAYTPAPPSTESQADKKE